MVLRIIRVRPNEYNFVSRELQNFENELSVLSLLFQPGRISVTHKTTLVWPHT